MEKKKVKDKESDPVWLQFREHVERVLKVEDVSILDKIAVHTTLDAVSKGFSNNEVAKMLELTVEDVEEDLKEFSDFKGFEFKCDLSPIKVFKNNRSKFLDIFQYKGDLEFAERLENFLVKFTERQEEIDKFYMKG